MRRFVAGAAMAVGTGMLAACGISQQQEVELGAQQADQVNHQLPIVQDPAINRYLNVLGDSLAHVTHELTELAFLHGEHERSTRSRFPAATST